MNQANPDERPISARFRMTIIAVLGAIAVGGLLLESCVGKPEAPVSTGSPSVHRAPESGVGCTGRVEPEDGVVIVAASPVLGRTPVIAKLMVREGQMVVSGEPIAVLEVLPNLESAVKQADARVAVAEARLAGLQAGPPVSDVLALQSEVARLEMESKAARQQLDRQEALARKDFVPRVQVDAARLKSDDAQHLLEAARDRLQSLTQVRGSDVNLAKAELAAAQADREHARIEEDVGTVRSPAKGRVIQVIARPGEAVGPGGVVAIADTSRMAVIAEIYETDIARVHPGQRAVISSESLPGSIEGVVDWISPQISHLDLPADPASPADQRVYEARIRVANPAQLAQRIHSKVNVLVQP